MWSNVESERSAWRQELHSNWRWFDNIFQSLQSLFFWKSLSLCQLFVCFTFVCTAIRKMNHQHHHQRFPRRLNRKTAYVEQTPQEFTMRSADLFKWAETLCAKARDAGHQCNYKKLNIYCTQSLVAALALRAQSNHWCLTWMTVKNLHSTSTAQRI